MPRDLPDAALLIDRLGLRPHPEGGLFAETYRSPLLLPEDALGPTFPGERVASTAILFLLPRGAMSRLHRIRSDEIWHFHLGSPLTILEIAPDGGTVETVLGTDLTAGQRPQHVVPAGSWFGAFPSGNAPYSLVGCTVAPGFDFADFEMGKRGQLLRDHPEAADVIRRLTDPD